MSRYQACRSIGIDPMASAFVAFVHFLVGAPQGRIAILHMTISYDPDQPYKRGAAYTLEDD